MCCGPAAVSSAQAGQGAPIRNCDQLPDTFHGYQTVLNLTSRNVRRQAARSTARAITKTMIARGDDSSSPAPAYFAFHSSGWTVCGRWTASICSGITTYSADVRSTASRERVIHFQFAGE
jgi:hypothetical protein